MKTLRIRDFTDQVIEHHKKGTLRGIDTGFAALDKLISFKLGYSTYILGFAAAGKTELHFDILLNLSEHYGYKHGLLSAEVGETKDVIAELIKKHLRKPFFQSDPYSVTEKEIHQAINFLDEHFFIAPSDQDWNVKTVYEYFRQVETDNRIKLQTTSIDPWNDLEENLTDFGGREDKYLTFALKHSRQVASVNNWHNFIVTHAKDMPPLILKSVDGGEAYNTAIPTLQSFAGGQVWGRRAMNVMAIWRPKKGTINPKTNAPFDENESRVFVLKSKPKGSGEQGECVVYWDWKKNRYYEKVDGVVSYAYQWKDVKKGMIQNFVEPNNSIFEQIRSEDIPF